MSYRGVFPPLTGAGTLAVVDLRAGLLVGAVLELVLLLVVVAAAQVLRRAFRAARADGLARLDAVRAGMRAASGDRQHCQASQCAHEVVP